MLALSEQGRAGWRQPGKEYTIITVRNSVTFVKRGSHFGVSSVLDVQSDLPRSVCPKVVW